MTKGYGGQTAVWSGDEGGHLIPSSALCSRVRFVRVGRWCRRQGWSADIALMNLPDSACRPGTACGDGEDARSGQHTHPESAVAKVWCGESTARGGGGGLEQGLVIRLFGGAYWPLATAHSDPLWVPTWFWFCQRGGGEAESKPNICPRTSLFTSGHPHPIAGLAKG